MTIRIKEYRETPNPNALKCVLEGVHFRERESFAAGRSATGRAPAGFAAALLQVPGVEGLLLLADWMTITKAPDADWKHIKPAVEKVLAQATPDA